MHGGGQEHTHRPGTENVLGIVGLGQACQVAGRELQQNRTHCQDLRDRLYEGLLRELGGEVVRLNGHWEKRLPNTLSVSFRGIAANLLLTDINEQVAASAGAACHAGDVVVSAVLEAMRVPPQWAKGTVRFSVGRTTTAEEIDCAISIVATAVRRLRSETALKVNGP